MIDDRVHSKEELMKVVSAPVLTELPRILTVAEERKQKRQDLLQLAGVSTIGLLTAVGLAVTFVFG